MRLKMLRKGRDPVRRSAGFTLLEVMVCLAVLAIAIPAFLAAIAQNVQLEQMNSETNIALAAANRVIEDVHALGFEQVDYFSVPQDFEATGLGNDGRTVKLTSGAGSTRVGTVLITPSTNTKTVLVTVTWRSITGSDRSIRLMTEVTSY